jgi:putative intracellular protease/amidase
MKRITIVTVALVLLGVVSFSLEAWGQSTSKVLMIPREGNSADLDHMIKMEVGVMVTLLKEAGFNVDIATPSGQPILGLSNKIEKVARLSGTNVDSYVGVIMPCMAVGFFPGPAVSSEVIAVVKKAVSDGKPVAAVLGSSITLAEAGLLKGKKYAFFADPLNPPPGVMPDRRYEGAIYGGTGVVQDGKIITSGVCANIAKVYGLEDGTTELTQKFVAALKSK